jgi:hypothetical protein
MILENHVSTSAEQSRSDRSSTSAHTPGPWSAMFNIRNQRTRIGDWNFYALDSHGMNTRILLKNGEGSEPDARLIAVAPDLLGALEQIAIVCTDNMDADKNHRMALDFVRQVANNAIAKATGA